MIEPGASQLASFQLELALALTESSDLVPLGRSLLRPLLRRLDCSAGALLSVPLPPMPLMLINEVSLPRNQVPVPDDALLDLAAEVHGGSRRYAALPDEDQMRHVFVLPHWGLLKLRRRRGEIPDALLRVLLSMSSRMAVVAQAAAARRALVDSDARQNAILESALDGIFSFDGEGRLIAFNAAAEGMFGVRREQILGRPLHEVLMLQLVNESSSEDLSRQLRRAQGAALNQRIEVEGRHASGAVFPMELAMVAVRTSAGETFTATVRDISHRQHIQRELRDSEARARAAFEQAAVGVLHQTADRRIVRVNQALCRMLGYTADELLALGAQGLVHTDDQPAGVEAMRLIFAGELEHARQEKRCRCRDGSWRWMRVTISPMRDDDGRILLAIAVLEDIDEPRRAAHALAATRERELMVATRIQTSLLVRPPPRGLPGLQLSIFSQASQHIDGDFVEVLKLGDGCVDIVTGDVMGKGLAAAMIGAATKLQISRSIVEQLLSQTAAAHEPPQPAAIVASLHEAITPTLQALDAFVTLCYTRLDSARNRLTWVGCGHEEGLLMTAGGGVERLRNQHPPVGVLQSEAYTQEERPFGPGQWLLLSSDGLTDAVNAQGQRNGADVVQRSFERRVRLHASVGAALQSMRRDLLGPGVRIMDDVSIVLVQRETEPLSRKEVPAQLDAIRALRSHVERSLAQTPLDEQTRGLLLVAVVEAFTNIVRHARERLEGAPIEVIIRRRDDRVEVDLVHLGAEFEPPSNPVETDFGAFPEGGLGLTIMRSATDRLDYQHVAGVNRVRLLKRFGTAAADV